MRHITGILAKRPSIVFLLGVLTLLFCLFDQYNPAFPLLLHMGSMGQGSASSWSLPIDSLVFVIKLVFSSGMLGYELVFIIIFSMAAALVGGFLFSGCFYILSNTLDGKEKVKGEFAEGVKKYFIKVSLMILKSCILGFAFLAVMSVVAIPALFTAKSMLLGKNELSIPAVLLSLITIFVLFFAGMFFRIYILFWYPAALNTSSGAFRQGKKAADAVFWKLVGGFLIFDVLFIFLEWLLLYVRYLAAKGQGGFHAGSIIYFVGNWFFLTLFFASLGIYIFSTYKKSEIYESQK